MLPKYIRLAFDHDGTPLLILRLTTTKACHLAQTIMADLSRPVPSSEHDLPPPPQKPLEQD